MLPTVSNSDIEGLRLSWGHIFRFSCKEILCGRGQYHGRRSKTSACREVPSGAAEVKGQYVRYLSGNSQSGG